jgi:predicted nucleic acid-binding protein
MSARTFLDTNILVYCFDPNQPQKQAIALALVAEALQRGNGIISWQVIQEFLNVATRKFTSPLTPEDAAIVLLKVLYPLCQVYPDLKVYQAALEIQQKTAYSFYDSLILAGAKQGGCGVIYSEDMQHGQQANGVRIINPFLE